MNILVDSCIWSKALRRKNPVQDSDVIELQFLVNEFRVQMIGLIRQEILSGIPSRQQFETLRTTLQAFPDLPLPSATYEKAAQCFNICRQHGVQGPNTDFLICGTALIHNLAIFTTDNDFELYQQHIPIQLHVPRETGNPGVHEKRSDIYGKS